MSFLEKYAKVYDAVHNNRDFESDIEIALEVLSREMSDKALNMKILDFGCGTGNHLNQLSRVSENISGYDRSVAMIEAARKNFPTLTFTSDILLLESSYDLVLSLFDVVSYQINTIELDLFFNQIASCLMPGGFVILDGWHSLGVRKSPPEVREKIIEVSGKQFIRKVIPDESNIEDTYTLRILVEELATRELIAEELHVIRAWDKYDLEKSARKSDLKILSFRNRDLNLNDVTPEAAWRFISVLQKLDTH